jgi:MoaA/NifB/PqqE/SkfB family radical SAM enzyme
MGYCKKHEGDTMIDLLSKIPNSILHRVTGKGGSIPFNLTISVSYNCNSRCRTCNIWKKKADDLSLEEYDKIFKKLGKSIFWATLSGGEPFLRNDLVEIASLLYKHCRPSIINIPTNGLMGKVIAEKCEKIAQTCPQSNVVLNLSLDGIGKKHDEIRGVPGNYERAMEAYRTLRKINLKNFNLGVHTVISKYNVNDIPEICDHVLDEMKPDSYISEIAEARQELDTQNEQIAPKAEEYAKAVDYIKQRTSRYKSPGISRFTRAFREEYYEYVKAFLKNGAQPIPCYAGVASGQISPEGQVWGCCVRAQVLGNLREHDYDFRKIWFSENAKKFRQSVKKGECACPLANAYYSSVVCDPLSLGKVCSKLVIPK